MCLSLGPLLAAHPEMEVLCFLPCELDEGSLVVEVIN